AILLNDVEADFDLRQKAFIKGGQLDETAYASRDDRDEAACAAGDRRYLATSSESVCLPFEWQLAFRGGSDRDCGRRREAVGGSLRLGMTAAQPERGSCRMPPIWRLSAMVGR